jgi:signal transduction histidine kinase
MDGVGLGLSISKQIINAHGGEIRVKSVKGRGSIFEFTVPAVKSHKMIKRLKTEKRT